MRMLPMEFFNDGTITGKDADRLAEEINDWLQKTVRSRVADRPKWIVEAG